MRYKSFSRLLLAAVSLVLLTACGDNTATVKPAAGVTAAAAGATTAATKVVSTQEKVAALNKVNLNLTDTTEALKKNDIAAARTAFQKYHDSWDEVESYVKDNSKDFYQAIEENLDKVDRELIKKDKPVAGDVLPMVTVLQQKFVESIKSVGGA